MIIKQVRLVYNGEISFPEYYEQVKINGVDLYSVLEDMKKSPSEPKAFILMNCQDMSLILQHELLKVVEEPRDNTMIIIHTTDLSKLINPLKFRCGLGFEEV